MHYEIIKQEDIKVGDILTTHKDEIHRKVERIFRTFIVRTVRHDYDESAVGKAFRMPLGESDVRVRVLREDK